MSGILWWNFAYTLILTRCIPWDCQIHLRLVEFCRGSNSEKSETIAKWHLSSVEALPSVKFWKSENGLIAWIEWNILIDFCVNWHCFWQDLAQEIVKCHFSSVEVCRAPNSEKVKIALSLELSGILCWNFAYILVLTRCSPWDCQMTFLKNVKFNS